MTGTLRKYGWVMALAVSACTRHAEPPHPRPRSGPGSGVIENDMLKVADAKQGQEISHVCVACHSFKAAGEPGKVGPILFGVVGAPIAGRSDFDYSPALRSLKGRTWTTDELYEWLRNPAGYAPGTRMMFNGLLDPQDRMDLIAYLMTLR